MKRGPYKRKPLADRFWLKVDRSPGYGPDGDCWRFTGATLKGGYGVIGAGGSGGGNLLAHRLSYELHHGPIPPGLRVCHTCDTPDCVNPAHLFLGTQLDNMQDCARKGRVSTRKLTIEQAREIRRLYAGGGISQEHLALQFSVDQTTVSRVILGRSYCD